MRVEEFGGFSDEGMDVAYFECDVVVSDPDFQLLFADDVFLWPVRVVFPLNDNSQAGVSGVECGEGSSW